MRPSRDSKRYQVQQLILAWLGSVTVRLLAWTWRVRHVGPDPRDAGPPFVAAIWHEGLLIAGGVYGGSGLSIPVSRSRDGDLVTAVIARLGFAESLRGSSSRGATTLLREMIRHLEAGGALGVLLDGPKGPRRTAKLGALAAASAAGAPLSPVAFAARPAWRLGSWDRALIPAPFARIEIRYGPPMLLPKKSDEATLEESRQALEAELERLEREAGCAIGAAPPPGPKDESPAKP